MEMNINGSFSSNNDRSRPEKMLGNGLTSQMRSVSAGAIGDTLEYDTTGLLSSHTTMIEYDSGSQEFVSLGGRSRTRTIEEDLEETGNELLKQINDIDDALKSRTNPQTPVMTNSRAAVHNHNIMLIADEVDRMTKQGTTIPNENMTLNNFEQNLRRKSEAMETVQSQYETKIIRLESTITQLRGTIKQNEKLLELSVYIC